jgi:hypothetical protein
MQSVACHISFWQVSHADITAHRFKPQTLDPYSGHHQLLCGVLGAMRLCWCAGAMIGTTDDLIKWYYTFTTTPEKVNLTNATVADLVKPYNPIGPDLPGVFFAQVWPNKAVSRVQANTMLLHATNCSGAQYKCVSLVSGRDALGRQHRSVL